MANIRFCTQRDGYSCVPIAVLNAMKWAGMPVTYKDMFPRLSRAMKTTMDGSSDRRMDMVLKGIARHCNWTVNRLYKFDTSIFEHHLVHPHQSAIVCYNYWDVKDWMWIRHCSFWLGATRRGRGMYFAGINDTTGGHFWFKREHVNMMLRPKAIPEIWLLTRYE